MKKVKEIDPEEYEDFKKDVKIPRFLKLMSEKFGEQMKNLKQNIMLLFGTVPDEDNHIIDAFGAFKYAKC